MDNQNTLGVITAIVAFIIAIITYIATDSLLLALCFGFLVSFVIIYVAVNITSKRDAKRRAKAVERELQEERKKREALNQSAQTGSWEFPAEDFYTILRDAKLTDLNSAYAEQKAKAVAEELIEKAGILRINATGYLQSNKLKEFWQTGEKLVREKENKKIAESKCPRYATPTEKEQRFIDRATALSVLTGCSKRVKMLEYEIEDMDEQIQALSQGEEAMRTLSNAMWDQQKKEGDWAIAGGIANGIAGPAAGMLAASQVMANNQKIQQHNEMMRRTSSNILSGMSGISSDRKSLVELKSKALRRQQEAKRKIALPGHSSNDIWKHIQAGKNKIVKSETGVLHISLAVRIEEPFVLDVPKGVGTVLDGTLKAEVWFDNKNLGTAYFPLPVDGISVNRTTSIELDAMLAKSVEFDGAYTLKLADSHNLWIMEA